MKSCLNCGRPASNDVLICDHCGRSYAYAGQDSDEISLAGSTQSERPTGVGAKTTGIVFILFGVLIIFFSWLTSSSSSSVDPDQVAFKTVLSMFGADLLQIGLVVWLAGYIVNAISFLPSRND